MKVLFLPKYGRMAASARYRFLQFFPILTESGIDCSVAPLFSDRYLEHKFNAGQLPLSQALEGLAKRILTILTAHRFDLVVLSYEAFPYIPPWLERFLTLRNIPYIYDFDDAIFHQYDCHPSPVVRLLLSDKIARVIRGARSVLAGSPYLFDYARRYHSQVEWMPTVVNLRDYPQPFDSPGPSAQVTIGWIGSPSTAPYLLPIAHVLSQFCQQFNARVILVGAGSSLIPGLAAERRAWSEATEVADCMEFDIGIMPLPDTPWARGKCAFKLIQYMACGRPVVASPVGMNVNLVNNSRAGLLASANETWMEALTTLYRDVGRRHAMGQSGRRHVERHYSLQAVAPRLEAVLRNALLPSVEPPL